MTISKTAILAEALRRERAALTAPKLVLGELFPQQNAFINDPSRFVAAQCSRRGGKTSGIIRRFIKTMEKYPKSQCLYIALTRDSAKEIIWQPLQEVSEQHNLGFTFVESKLEVTHPNGAKLRIYGADMKNFIKRLKGRKYPGVAIDEAQDFGSHLESLINDVLTPSIADYEDGWLAVTGTPGPVPQGYFFEVTQNGRFGYSTHKWTLLDNPHMPKVNEFLTELKTKREWADDNPTYRREYKNEWVLDPDSLWVRYVASINDYDELPKNIKWNYILGIDIGYRDADALAVIAWSDETPTTYLVEELITPKQDITGLIKQINDMRKKYDFYKMVMDAGALGKKIQEEIIIRHSIPVEAADKLRKQENVELLNDSLRLGKFKAKGTSRFALDSYLVQVDWDKSTPDKIVIKKKPHSDIIDAVLYAFKCSYAYAYTPPKSDKPAWGSKEWAEQQTASMFEAELEGMKAEQARKEEYGMD